MQQALTQALRWAAAGAILVLAGGPTALAGMKYPDMQGPGAWGAGQPYQGGYTVYRSGVWNGRVYGTAGPDSGYPSFAHFSAPVAREQLNAWGFSNVQQLKPEHGWSAQAWKGGHQYHVVIDDRDRVAVYTGK